MDSYKAAQQRVRKRLKKRKEFFINFTSWIIVCSGLLVVNALVSPEHWWVLYPFLGWGLSVAFQGYEVFGQGFMSDDWKERQVEEELHKMGYDSDRETFDLNQPRPMFRKQKAWDDRDLV